MVEVMASFVHDIWSRWIDYLFSKSEMNEDGSCTIPANLVSRWQRQKETFYEDLPKEERYSDKEIAKEIMMIVKEEEDSWN